MILKEEHSNPLTSKTFFLNSFSSKTSHDRILRVYLGIKLRECKKGLQ